MKTLEETMVLPMTRETERKMMIKVTLIRDQASFPLIKARSRARVSLSTSVTFIHLPPHQVLTGYTVIGDTVYYTTGVRRGKCYIIVTDIARESFVGRTASLVGGSTGPGHFHRVMTNIGTTLLVL